MSSAQDCISEWKRDIFLSNNPHLREQFRELTVPSVLERIQRWLDLQGGFPPANDPSEYGFYIERCYPISRDRKAFFQTKKNPFMSHDDAARVGRTIQELYFKARGELPRRVVIHKRTPFIKSERLGLQEGLRGVDALDLIEINHTPLRYVASRLVNGQPDEDRWPVKRGTVVALDRYSALLWIHGLAAALNPQRNYFQGKRRIPSPVLIHRHAGETDLALVAEEILALSGSDK